MERVNDYIVRMKQLKPGLDISLKLYQYTLGCFIFSKCYISRHIDVPLESHLLTSSCVKFQFFLMMFRGRTLLRLFREPPLLVLHRDGKLPPQATSKYVMEERIAVVATGEGFE